MHVRRSLLAILIVSGFLMAACGSDDSGDAASTSAAAGTTAASSATTAATAPADTSPIPLYAIGAYDTAAAKFPYRVAAIQAAVKAVNDSGGVNGRQIELTVCNDGADPNASLQCSRDAVDKKAVAIVGAFVASPDMHTVMSEAGIPALGNYPSLPEDLSSEDAWPLYGGNFAVTAGEISVLAAGGSTKFSLLVADSSAAGDPLIDAATQSAQAQGGELVNTVRVPAGAPDVASYIAQAQQNGADGIAIATAPGDAVKVLGALKQSGSTIPIAMADLGPTFFKAVGPLVDGVHVVGFTTPLDSGDPGMQQFIDESKANDPAFDPAKLDIPFLALDAWASVHLFAMAADGLDEITPATVTAAMSTLTDVKFGFLPPIDFSKPAVVSGNLTRIFNPDVIYGVSNGGVVTWEDTFQNPFEAQ